MQERRPDRKFQPVLPDRESLQMELRTRLRDGDYACCGVGDSILIRYAPSQHGESRESSGTHEILGWAGHTIHYETIWDITNGRELRIDGTSHRLFVRDALGQYDWIGVVSGSVACPSRATWESCIDNCAAAASCVKDKLDSGQDVWVVFIGSIGRDPVALSGRVDWLDDGVLHFTNIECGTRVIDLRMFEGGMAVGLAAEGAPAQFGCAPLVDVGLGRPELDRDRSARLALSAQLVEAIHAQGLSPYQNAALYRYLAADPHATGDLVRRSYVRPEDPVNSPYRVKMIDALIREFSSLGPEWIALLVDPGVASRWQQFCEFVQHENLVNGNAFDARSLFEQALGTTSVYRCLALPRAVADKIRSSGVLLAPALALSKDGGVEAIERILSPRKPLAGTSVFQSTIVDDIYKGSFGARGWRVCMSASGYVDVAASIGWERQGGEPDCGFQRKTGRSWWPQKAKEDPAKLRPYMATIKLPELSLVYKDTTIIEAHDLSFKIGNQFYNCADRKVEMYIPFCVPLSQCNFEEISVPENWGVFDPEQREYFRPPR